jgi:hypothetical protein
MPTSGTTAAIEPNAATVVVHRRLVEVSNWAELKTACDGFASSGTVTLSDGFVMGAYTSEIDFRKKQLVLIGNGKILDDGNGGAHTIVDSTFTGNTVAADLDASFLEHEAIYEGVSRLAHHYGPSAPLLPVRFSLHNKDTAHHPTVVSHRSGLSFPFVSLHWALLASVPAVPEDATLMHALEESESVIARRFSSLLVENQNTKLRSRCSRCYCC